MTIGCKEIKKDCSIFVILLPLLSIYKSPIKFLDLGSFIMIVLAGFICRAGFYRKKNNYSIVKVSMWSIYIAYVIGITCVSYFFRAQYVVSPHQYMIRMIKNLFYIIFTLYICWKGYFDLKYAAKYYERIAILATITVYIQYLSYLLFRYDFVGYSAKWAYTEEYKYRASNLATGMFRPTSIFYEPAHYFEYVSIILVLYIFYSKDKRSMINAVFVTLGVVLSTSGQGIIFTAMLWGIWLLKKMVRYKWKRTFEIEVLFSVFFLFVAAGYLVLSDFGKRTISRILSPQNTLATIGGRSDGFATLKDLTMGEWIFGRGYGNYTATFFSSWPFNICCLGIIGTMIIIFIYLYCLKYTDKKMLVLLNALMCVFSNVFMGVYFVFFFSFILTLNNNDNKKYVFERMPKENRVNCAGQKIYYTERKCQ